MSAELTEAEREALGAAVRAPQAVAADMAYVYDAVERIVADRLAAVEAERDEERARLIAAHQKANRFADQNYARAEAAEAEVSALRERLARVKALADEWDRHSDRMYDEARRASSDGATDAAIVLRSKSGTYAANAERLADTLFPPDAPREARDRTDAEVAAESRALHWRAALTQEARRAAGGPR